MEHGAGMQAFHAISAFYSSGPQRDQPTLTAYVPRAFFAENGAVLWQNHTDHT